MDAGKESRLQSLLERLEKASGGDREIDARLAEAFGGFADVIRALNEDGSTVDAMVDYGEDSFDECPRYTSSLDAALSLVERVMPGWTRAVDASLPSAGIDVDLYSPNGMKAVGTHARETHATLIALLKAVPNCSPQAEAVEDARD